MAKGADAVCVVIPAFNGERHIGQAIGSILAQAGDELELIVVDAGSGDGTVAVVEALAAADRRVRLIRSAERLSAPQARNVGLAACEAEFLLTCDQDDLALPGRLSVQVATLRADVNLVTTGGRLERIDARGDRISVEPGPTPAGPWSPAMLRWFLLLRTPSPSSALAHRAAELRKRGGFDVMHPLCDDYSLLWSLAAEPGAVRITSDVVGEYRSHADQTSRQAHRRQGFEVDLLRQRIMYSVLGTRPALDVIWALAHPARTTSPDALLGALELSAVLLDRFLVAFPTTPAERTWIQQDWAHQRESIVAALERLLDTPKATVLAEADCQDW